MKVYRFYEYQRVRCSEDGHDDTLPSAVMPGLVAASDNHQREHGERLFDWIHPAEIRFLNVVGVVQVGDVTLEILPKVQKGQPADTTSRRYLLNMLRLSGVLPLTSDSVASLSTETVTLIDIVLRLFAVETRHQLKAGRVHQYQHRHQTRTAIRGRLSVREHLRNSAFGHVRFPCTYSDFVADTALNRVLRTAARTGWRLTSDVVIRQQLQWIENQFDDVTLLVLSRTSPLPDIQFDRSNRRYITSWKLAERILQSCAPDLRAGASDFVSMLFSMNDLFESSMAAVFRSIVPGTVPLHTQGPGQYLLQRPSGSVFAMKPDIVVGWKREDYPTTVIDTKWKLLDSKDMYRLGVSQADAYLMYAYAHRYMAERVVLLYPHWNGLTSSPGLQAVYHLPEDSRRTIEVWTVDVMEETLLHSVMQSILLPRNELENMTIST